MAKKTTKKGTKFYVCATAQESDLTQSAFEGLTWVQVGKVGEIGDFGPESEINTYDTLDEAVSQKQKGTANAGDPVIEVASIYDDAGQVIMRDFADPLNQSSAAFKIERNDAPAGMTNTIFYTRGVVASVLYPGGGANDFDLERYTLGLNQLPIRVDPETP